MFVFCENTQERATITAKKAVVGGGLLYNCHCYDYARDEFPRLEFTIKLQLE